MKISPTHLKQVIKEELDIMLQQLKEGRPPMGVLMHPKKLGLMPVKKIFGVIFKYPDKEMLDTGHMVQNEAGDVLVFVGMDKNNKPILATEDDWETMYSDYLTSRERHES